MKKVIMLIGISLIMLITLCSCTVKSDKKMSQKELDNMKAEYAEYLKGKYPNETFDIKIWEEYCFLQALFVGNCKTFLYKVAK